MSAKFGLEDYLIKYHIQMYLKKHPDVQQLWNSVATIVPGVEAMDDINDEINGTQASLRVTVVEEEKPEDFNAGMQCCNVSC